MSTKNPVRWYNLVAPLYDFAVSGVYTGARRETAKQLHLKPGLTVLDVACGTGENFQYLLGGIGSRGMVIGTDFSKNMLARAKQKIPSNQWGNVHLLQADAQTLSIKNIKSGLSLPKLQVDRILCTLGYSVMPKWEKVFERTWDILEPGGRYAIMDWHASKPTFYTRIVDRVAASDIGRRWWEALERLSVDYLKETIVNPAFHGMVFVVSGTKPV